MTKLSVKSSSKTPSSKVSSKSKAPIVDSWEDVASDSSSDIETETHGQSQSRDIEMPGPPPPTPVSTTPLSYPSFPSSQQSAYLDPSAPRTKDWWSRQEDGARPEKQTAVAGRLIAGALGVRPQRTKEQREYDKITRENEKKRIEKRKEEQRKEAEEDERAKNEVWGS